MGKRPTAIVCGRPGVDPKDYETHLIKMFARFLADSKKFDRCPWCFHKLKNCGKCKVCDCEGKKKR